MDIPPKAPVATRTPSANRVSGPSEDGPSEGEDTEQPEDEATEDADAEDAPDKSQKEDMDIDDAAEDEVEGNSEQTPATPRGRVGHAVVDEDVVLVQAGREEGQEEAGAAEDMDVDVSGEGRFF